MDRPVPPFHRVAGFNNISILQHIVRDKHTSRNHESHDFGKPYKILSLRRVHKDKIIGTGKFLQDFSGIAGEKSDSVTLPRSLKVSKGFWYPFFIFFNRCNTAVLRHGARHQKR